MLISCCQHNRWRTISTMSGLLFSSDGGCWRRQVFSSKQKRGNREGKGWPVGLGSSWTLFISKGGLAVFVNIHVIWISIFMLRLVLVRLSRIYIKKAAAWLTTQWFIIFATLSQGFMETVWEFYLHNRWQNVESWQFRWTSCDVKDWKLQNN